MAIRLLTRLSTILLFFAFLLTPVSWRLVQRPAIEPLQEFRTLAARPRPEEYFGSDKLGFLAFTKQFDSWFSDQFPTRPLWVRLYTQALYLFRESDQVHIGSQGWLYYRSVIDKETPALELATAEFRSKMIDEFAHLSELMKLRGVTLIVMPVALKARYYPEFLPPSASHARRFKFYDTFMDELVRDGRVEVVDTRAPLEQAKAAGLKIFHKTDFHWTDAGGAVALQGLASRIAVLDGNPELADLWRYEYVIEQNASGGQARALPLFKSPTETTVNVRPVAPVTYFEERTDEAWSEWTGVARSGQDRRLGAIAVYGDSFFDAGARSGFFNLFSGFSRARIYTHDPIELFRNRLPGTRYFVFEFITSSTFGAEATTQRMIQALEADPAL